MALAAISVCINETNSDQLPTAGGRPAVGNPSKILVRLEASPTRFGRLTLKASIGAEGLEVDARLLPGARRPERIMVRLPIMFGSSLRVNGERIDLPPADTPQVDVTEIVL